MVDNTTHIKEDLIRLARSMPELEDILPIKIIESLHLEYSNQRTLIIVCQVFFALLFIVKYFTPPLFKST